MQSTFELTVYREDVARIVVTVFQTMLDLETIPTHTDTSPAPDGLTAAIYFAGSWRGAVLFQCTREQAFEFTHRLMSIDRPDSINDDVRDALGELANMLAGNLKSVLPRGVDISMPSVVEGTDYSVRVCGGNLTDRLSFTGDLGLIWVTLIEMLPED